MVPDLSGLFYVRPTDPAAAAAAAAAVVADPTDFRLRRRRPQTVNGRAEVNVWLHTGTQTARNWDCSPFIRITLDSPNHLCPLLLSLTGGKTDMTCNSHLDCRH